MRNLRSDYLDKSRERLERIACKKIKTTMIGAISSIEEHFGFFLESEDDNIKEVFNKLRSDILDKGNQQIRNLSQELKLYDISIKKNEIVLPVRKIGE